MTARDAWWSPWREAKDSLILHVDLRPDPDREEQALALLDEREQERWKQFKAPIHRVMVDPRQKVLRTALMVTIPLLVAFMTFDRVRPTVSAPAALRSVHPAPPGQIDFRGETMVLNGLENPLRHEGDLEEHYEEGKRIYVQNCMPCHGDALDGQGHFASAFNPAPLSFQDPGTIVQLTESFVFWRIAKGGPGLPREATPWDSATSS